MNDQQDVKAITITSGNFPTVTKLEQKFVSFHLGKTALIPLDSVTELFQISLTDILPVPGVPNCVLGIYNWREEMLWMIDLNALTGLSSILQSPKQLFNQTMTMVMQVEGQFMGLIVEQVRDIETLDIKQLKTPSSGLFSSELLPFVQGYFIENDNEIKTLINPNAIINHSLWH